MISYYNCLKQQKTMISFDFGYFYKGAISGATGLLLSHPIDTIKSNVQEGKPIRWNLRYLYRGVFPPLLGMGVEKAIVFGTYQNVYKYLNEHNSNQVVIRGVSGAVAGFTASFVVTPVERLKILYQTGNVMNTKRSLSLHFLYRGFGNTLSREMPGFAIYFNIYNILKQKTENPGPFHHLLYGALSGSAAWAFIYPQDLVKTRIQASSNLTVKDVVKKIYKTSGFRGFFQGFHLALIRSVPLHAGTLAMFEILNN